MPNNKLEFFLMPNTESGMHLSLNVRSICHSSRILSVKTDNQSDVAFTISAAISLLNVISILNVIQIYSKFNTNWKCNKNKR